VALTEVHGEAIAGRSATVRKELARMATHTVVTMSEMIELLCEAEEKGYATQWGYASLPVYGEAELGLKPSKTRYLARIGKVMKAVGLKRGQWEAAGISKLREIARLDPEASFWNADTHTNESLDDHIVRLVVEAPDMTAQQVRGEVLRLQNRTGPDSPVTRSTVYPKSVWDNVIVPARELARRLLGSAWRDAEGNAKEYSDAACDECICASFLADVNNQPEPVELPMEKPNEMDKF